MFLFLKMGKRQIRPYRDKDVSALARKIGLSPNAKHSEVATRLMLELGWAPMGYKAVLRRYFEQQYSADAKPMNLPVKKVRARARVREIRAIAEHAKRKRLADAAFVNSDAFLESYAWRRVRMEALKKHGSRCQCCGASPADGLRMHVDHIKPRRKYPDLALDVNNLQVLCEVCNHGKGNWDETDWRPDESEHSEDTIGKTLRIIRGGKE